jgi:hypothetical protein
VRAEAFRFTDEAYLYRIITRAKVDGFRSKFAVSNDLQELLQHEWKYIVEVRPVVAAAASGAC